MQDREIILTCEHATNYIDGCYNNLGLSVDDLKTHIAYDKGCKEITIKLAKELNCKYVLGQCSRLVVDLNRRIGEAELIVNSSDGIFIPDNQNISLEERNNRLNRYYYPYHNQIAKMIESCEKEPFVFSIHGYTKALMSDNKYRPWNAGLLYFEENETIKKMLDFLDKTGMNIGRNQPYDINKYNTGSVAIHGQDKAIANALIEIRDDEFDDFENGVNKWVEILKEVLSITVV